MVGITLLLDAGPLGMITNPKHSALGSSCKQWLALFVGSGARVIVPEIADYEVRRELIRGSKKIGIEHLDALGRSLEYLPLTTVAMRHAAALWAQARQQGQPTAADNTIDADMILAGQALSLNVPNFIVATTNVGHLGRFVRADNWTNITPL